jgi:osmoprotectant transport system permease protein
LDFWGFMVRNHEQVLVLMRQHLELTFLSVGIAALFAFPLGLAATRLSALGRVVTPLANVGQTLPSIAVLALVIPFLGIGFTPALLALTLRAFLPIYLNSYVGIRSVDPALVDAARGLGFDDFQVLFRVEVPVASPVILAGIKTAAVQNVAIATLAAFIGGGGLGDLILQGLALVDTPRLLAGAVPTALLAVTLEVMGGWVERLLTPRGLVLNTS